MKFQNERGFSWVELLIVFAILGIIAAIVIPMHMTVGVSVRVSAFQQTFGVILPITFSTRNDPLTEKQKHVLRPLVQARLGALCGPELPLPDSTDPTVVQQYLDAVTNRAQRCKEATALARKEGFIDATSPDPLSETQSGAK